MKRKFSILLAVLLMLALAVPAMAAPEGVPHVVDNAGLLSADEFRALERHAKELSLRQKFDFVIVTVDTVGAASMRGYADDFFDYNDYGAGPEYDGILLLVSMDDAKWQVSTHGFGRTAFTDYGRTQMMDEVEPYLTANDFSGAFEEFLSIGEDYVEQAKTGAPVDVPERGGFSWLSLVICGALGFGLAFIPMSVLKKQVKNVSAQPDALGYVVGDGLELSRESDRFLYSSVSRRPRPKDNSSSGGSRTHTSSSGRTHGGSGGSF